MKGDALDAQAASAPVVSEGSLGLGWSYTLEPRARGLGVRLTHPSREPLAIEITMSARGPVIRASAVALELDAAEEINARCERFSVDARDSVSISAREIVCAASESLSSRAAAIDLQATTGDLRLRANDDVQLLGEQVLLNCERNPPLPEWVSSGPAQELGAEAALPRQDASGDAELLATLARR